MAGSSFAEKLGQQAAGRQKQALGSPAFSKEDIAPYLIGGAALGTAGAGFGYGMHRLGNAIAPHQSEDARKADRNISVGMGIGTGISPLVGDILRRWLRNRGGSQ